MSELILADWIKKKQLPSSICSEKLQIAVTPILHNDFVWITVAEVNESITSQPQVLQEQLYQKQESSSENKHLQKQHRPARMQRILLSLSP